MSKDRLQQLRKRINTAPAAPGVYRWLDEKGDVLYVGKAKNLKKRLQSYVQKDVGLAQGPWKRSLMEHAADFDVTIAGSELEALVLETNLIKEIKPKYNVLMKDDKNYVYVRIEIAKPYPPVEVVRRMGDDKAKYFGPFLSAYELNRTLDMLHEIFHFRACRASIDTLNADKTPTRACVESQIGQCNGLCAGAVAQEQYRHGVEEVMRFLKGDKDEALAMLRKEMQEAAAAKKFEKAAKLRDALSAMETMKDTQTISGTDGTDIDAFGVAMVGEGGGKSQIVVLRVRGGKLIEERSIALAGQAESIADILTQFLPQYYAGETDIPGTIVIPESFEDINVFTQWIEERQGKRVGIRIPERGRKSKLLVMAEENALQKITQQFAKWEAAARNIETALKELEDTLKLPAPPKRIEGYDISHLGGVETVGSMVVMKNGKPANAEYRSFTLRTVLEGEIDDYKSLREVLRRRLLYLVRNLKEEEALWKKRNIVFGKAKKGEQETIAAIIEKEGALSAEEIDYKQFLVARNGKEIISCARLVENAGTVLEIKSVWTEPKHRGQKIGQFLVRKILAGIKKGKVYVIFDPIPKLEEYYSEIGFRYVQTPPDVLREKTERFHKEHPEHPVGNIMVYIAVDNKQDVSLTSHPDLLVIDGGKGQLSAVSEVLKELKLEIPVIGLAKREEEIFLPGFSLPVELPKQSQAQFLLQRLRDEAHRSANRHREKRLESRSLASGLDEIPGIGPKTKRELLTKFGSVAGIQEASDAALLTILNATQLKGVRDGLPCPSSADTR